MKNLYPKGKGKIHPSPAAAAQSAGGPSSPTYDALAVLRLLPAAILALAAALTYDDKEVLAYLITRSIHGPAAAAAVTPAAAGAERRRRPGARAAAHRPLFDCGCFDCYTSFWSRWDCSPDRELIHQAIEAFEEHLATSEKRSGRGRRRERRAGERAGKEEEERRMAVEAEAAVVEEEKPLEGPAAGGEAASFSCEVNEASGATEAAAEVGGEEMSGEEEAVAVGGERRRGWPDVAGLFNSRFWSLWGPGV